MLRRQFQASRRSGQVVQGALAFGNPLLYAVQYGLLLWLRADMGITLGGTLRGTGTGGPPVWTITGTATRQVGLHLEIDSVDGGTGLGQATYKWSENNGATYVATGVVTAAGPTALGTTGLSVSQAVGPYNIDNKWDATVSAWADQSGNANHAIQATAADQPRFTLAGFGGYQALDWTVSTNSMGMATPSLSYGLLTQVIALRADATSGFVVHRLNGADLEFLYGSTPATYINHGGVITSKNAGAWLNDSVRRTIAKRFDGTHAGHLIYKNASPVATSDGGTGDPGAVAMAAPLYVGRYTLGTSDKFVGLIREVVVFSSSVPASVVTALHQGMAARAAGAI